MLQPVFNRVTVSLRCCANNVRPLMVKVNMTFCSHFIMCACIVIKLNMSYYCVWLLLWESPTVDFKAMGSLCSTGFISISHYSVKTRVSSRGFRVGFFFCHKCSIWCSIESVVCTLLPKSWQRLCSVLPFHRWVSPYKAGDVFVLYGLTADPADHKSCRKRSEESRINPHHGRGKYL